MTVSRRIGIGLLVLVAALAAFVWWPAWGDDRIVLPARTNFSKGPYSAYVQPWGGDADRIYRYWSSLADSAHLDVARFPDNTGMRWRWPPHAPRNAGVWAYDFVAYGNYDGGRGETPVTPRRIDAIAVLRQDFAWSAPGLGRANVLTEFYLRSDPDDSESKLLEIGFVLAGPPQTMRFAAAGRQLGTYRDPAGTNRT
jgi:hypothetical protein